MVSVSMSTGDLTAWTPTQAERTYCGALPAAQRPGCVHSLWDQCAQRAVPAGATAACADSARCASARRSRRAWVTLINGNSVNYTAMALTSALSVRMFSCYDHIVIATPEVSADVRSRLTAVGADVRNVSWVRWKNQPQGIIDGYQWLMTKLQLWSVEGYEQVALIDADIILLRPDADEIFDQCDKSSAFLCAAVEKDFRTVNSGIMVARPGRDRLAAMLDALANFSKPTAIFPDMAFLANYFRVRDYVNHARLGTLNSTTAHGLQLFNIGPRGRRLPALFDTCFKARIPFMQPNRVLPALPHLESTARMWHACGRHKLEALPLCPSVAPTTAAAVNATPAFCASRILRLYQWLYLRVNPCAAHSASAARCGAGAAPSGCRWCSDLVRCVPKTWPCYLDDTATRAYESRMTAAKGKSTTRPGWCSHACDPKCCALRMQHRNASKTKRARRP